MTKLTQEQREQLADLISSGEWDIVLAVAAMGVENQQSRVLTADITKGDREIMLARAKLDGARDLQMFLQNQVKKKT